MRQRKVWKVRLNLMVLSLLVGAALTLIFLFPVFAQEPKRDVTQKPWIGKLSDGREITQPDLDQILQAHALWLKTEGKEGQQAHLRKAKLKWANLSRAKLSQADLEGAVLFMANLSRADLSEANLFGADLNGVNLSWATLRYANLIGAILFDANLSRANLSFANLSRADIRRSNLSEAFLYDADLKEANCEEANFQKALLKGANLHMAYLRGANLSRADLWNVDLRGAFLQEADMSAGSLGHANLGEAFLRGANLRGAGLQDAKLNRANLSSANLSNADLRRADLSEAYLNNADLKEADCGEANFQKAVFNKTNLHKAFLGGANLKGTIFEPEPGTLPGIIAWLEVEGLSGLTYKNSSYALVDLREVFKKAGMREPERELTFALNHNRRIKLWEKGGLLAKVESLFHLVCFEWTCGYGLNPGRPLKVIGLGLLIFGIPYTLALRNRKRENGLWVLPLPDRVLDRDGKDRPHKLTTHRPFRPLPQDSTKFGEKILRGWRIIRLGFYFSLLSAFSLGWRELNVGNWITRIQKREYTLRATGWVRSVSGLQSLLSVYMLALWVLSYFGRPFD